jgi:spermidine synthase
MPRLLLANVFVVATCGFVYELLAGTLASYLYGSSVVEFSIVVGLYTSAMGAGAWLSRRVERDPARRFLWVELGVALAGGLSAPLLLFAFARGLPFRAMLVADLAIVGVLVGVELPLLMRLLKGPLGFDEVVSRALALDYAGALAGALLFPLFLVPNLGLVRTSALFGLLNAAVALAGTGPLQPAGGARALRWCGAGVVAVLVVVFAGADHFDFMTAG